MSLLTATVCWLLAGFCGLTLLPVTDAATPVLQIIQKPRFYGVMTGKKVAIYCKAYNQTNLHWSARWHKASKYDSEKMPIQPGERIKFRHINKMQNSILIISDLRRGDQGVYFCEIHNVSGPGTEVQVASPVNLPNVLYRSQVKDGLIILQALLLAMFIAAFIFRKKTLALKQDDIYEEPEVDHIYEGLAIETCGGGDLYEEISVYAQPEGAEAPWE